MLGWYFATDSEVRKRNLGTVLTVLMVIFCLMNIYPPFDVKDASGKKVITHGKDSTSASTSRKRCTSFLVRLNPPVDETWVAKTITPDMVDQAVEAFRNRIDPTGTREPIITPQGTDRILVQLPGIHNQAEVDEATAQLKQVAKLEFKLVLPGQEREQLVKSKSHAGRGGDSAGLPIFAPAKR